MAVRLLEYFRVFGWTDKDINLRTEPQPEREKFSIITASVQVMLPLSIISCDHIFIDIQAYFH